MSNASLPPALITSVVHLTAAKYYALASFAMLVYDILLTFPREVDKIWWKKRFSGLTVLWVCNRWVFLLMIIPTIASMHDPAFTGKVDAYNLERYFRYPGYVQAFQRTVIGSVFILRTYCIYNRSLRIAALISLFLFAEIFIKLYTNIKWGQPVQAPPGIIACVLTVSQANSGRFIIYFLSELIVDTLVLVLTIIRTVQSRVLGKNKFKGRSGVSAGGELLRLILKDGVIYFAVMCSANLITVLMYLTATEDLKAANADFAVMANSLLVARLILNLKSAGSKTSSYDPNRQGQLSEMNWRAAPGLVSSQIQSRPGRWEALVLGDIGNEMEGDTTQGTTSVSTLSTIGSESIALKPTATASPRIQRQSSTAASMTGYQQDPSSMHNPIASGSTMGLYTLSEDAKEDLSEIGNDDSRLRIDTDTLAAKMDSPISGSRSTIADTPYKE